MAYGKVVINDLAAWAAMLLDSRRLLKSSFTFSSTRDVACFVAPIFYVRDESIEVDIVDMIMNSTFLFSPEYTDHIRLAAPALTRKCSENEI